MTNDEIVDRIEREYGFQPLPEDKRAKADMIRAIYRDLAIKTVDMCPDSRARSLALTNLQQAKMWALQSIVDG